MLQVHRAGADARAASADAALFPRHAGVASWQQPAAHGRREDRRLVQGHEVAGARDHDELHVAILGHHLFRVAAPPAPNPDKHEEELLDAYVFVDDADALHAEYAARGAVFTRPLGDTPWGMREFVLRDIDGRLLAFGADPPSDPSEQAAAVITTRDGQRVDAQGGRIGVIFTDTRP